MERQANTKTLKPLSAKKAPEPAAGHTVIEDWMQRLMPGLQPLVKLLDESIRRTVPGLQYGVKWKRAYYGLPEVGWIIELAAYDVSVNLVFFGGAAFNPPPPLGSDERSRYVKLRTLEEARAPRIGDWIHQATRVQGWKPEPLRRCDV
jgi:hypothetical protein